MKFISFAAATVMIGLLLMPGCSKKDDGNPAAPPAITKTVYSGKINDPVMTNVMGAAYSGTTYVYSLCSNDSFALTADVGFGVAMVETGTYSVSGSAYGFVPKVNRINNPTTHQMEVSTILRANYSGTMVGTSLTIPAFVDVGGTRVIGNLTVTKQ